MKKLLVILVVMLSLVGIASAEETIYILGNRNVYVVSSVENPGNLVIVDCKAKNNPDPIGCIIAANLEKEKKRVAKQLSSK